jgi:hypothetical protein
MDLVHIREGRMRIKDYRTLFLLAAVCLAVTSCVGGQAATSPQTEVLSETTVSSSTALPSTQVPAYITPSQVFTATATGTHLPEITLKKGDFYFNVDGKPSFFFSRNIAGYKQVHYKTFLDWSRIGGSKVARIQLDSLGMGYTSTGDVDENWALQWDQIFDMAQADGIYILPVFSGWFDWNAGTGYSTWKSNPLNQTNGGPVKSPAEIFQKDSATQAMWMKWMQTLVKRWQGRQNILGWEVFSEVNLASGSTEKSGIDFVNSAADVIRANDPSGRPVTASIADTGTWPNFYQKTNIDFINLHPYPPSAKLDRTIVTEVRKSLARYGRPLLIGESGFGGPLPDSNQYYLTDKSRTGTNHAIWAAVVSGAMNGRALYWEDSFGIYFSSLGVSWMEKYKNEELPAENFGSTVDFSGFQPLTSTSSSGVWGAAVGNEEMVLGWFRDAKSEPPNWNLQPVISKQTVTITVPGSAANWQVDFYDTKTGTNLISSAAVTRKGRNITIALPDFQDDIAFKLHVQK